MKLSEQARIYLLLTLSIGKDDDTLSINEWVRLNNWLKQYKSNIEASSLLKGNVQGQLSGLQLHRYNKNEKDRYINITPDLIESLLERDIDPVLKRWQDGGLQLISQSDSDYPEKLKLRLEENSPIVLFGCGNKKLLNSRGIAVVGSRNASDDDKKFTRKLGKQAAVEGYSIISGSARGVDQSAMLGALDNQGTAIGVMADSLLKAAASKKYSEKISSGDLVLITPFNPEAGFNVIKAMNRNQYIYCLADAAVLISSAAKKGGSLKGAIKNQKKKWVTLWVKSTTNVKSGNLTLVKDHGAKWLPEKVSSVKELIETDETARLESSAQQQLDFHS